MDREQQDDGNNKEILQQTEVLQSMRPLIVAQHQFCWFGAQMCLVDPGHEQKKVVSGGFFSVSCSPYTISLTFTLKLLQV